MSNEKEIDEILIKLQNNNDIILKYNVTKIQNYKSIPNFIIEIKRKEKPLEQQYVYNPSVSINNDYNLEFFFKIQYIKGYIYNTIHVFPVENTGFNIVTDFHTQTTITGEININYIMDYIDQTEFTIINKRAFGNDTYFPSNSYICEKCKCVKKKPR